MDTDEKDKKKHRGEIVRILPFGGYESEMHGIVCVREVPTVFRPALCRDLKTV